MSDLPDFLQFLKEYFFSRALHFGQKFETVKDFIVALLVVKRGKYSSSFLNTSFFLLVVTVIIGGPAIAENNLLTGSLNDAQDTYTSSVIAFDPFENSVVTNKSERPRDKVIEYKVKSGDTLESIAKKFAVSVDTIKWSNDLKTDTIKPDDTLDIPPVTGIVHKVVAGDNIYAVAKKYHTNAQAIVNFPFNDFADLETFQLTPGQTLIVPGGYIEEAPGIENTVRFYAQAQAGVKGTSNFIWPTTGLITTYPVWYHMALDIASSSAPAIIAADTGTVTYSGCIQWGYGCHVIMDHGNGYQTLYGHMSVLSVSPGQVISKGRQVGVMGSTGRSTGTHLHFEIRSGGSLMNPLNFLQ